jgi:hypothetical protein
VIGARTPYRSGFAALIFHAALSMRAPAPWLRSASKPDLDLEGSCDAGNGWHRDIGGAPR